MGHNTFLSSFFNICLPNLGNIVHASPSYAPRKISLSVHAYMELEGEVFPSLNTLSGTTNLHCLICCKILVSGKIRL